MMRPFARVPGQVTPRPPLDANGLLQEILVMLGEILEDALQRVPEGRVVSYTDPVPDATPVPRYFDPPLFSVVLTNTGAATVQYRIPYGGSAQWSNLLPTQVVTFNFPKGLLTGVDYRVTGAASTVEALGMY